MPVIKGVARLGESIARTVGGLFVRGGEEAVEGISALKGFFGKGAAEATENAPKYAEEVMSKMSKALSSGSALEASWVAGINKSKSLLDNIISAVKQDQSVVEGARVLKAHEADTILDFMQKAKSEISSGNLEEVINLSKFIEQYGDDIGKLHAIPGADLSVLKNLKNTLTGTGPLSKDALHLSNVEFLDKYMKFGEAQQAEFLANPKNLQRLKQLKTSGVVRNIIEGNSPWNWAIKQKYNIRGLTLKDKAIRTGVGTAALAAVPVGIVKVFDWFGDKHPSNDAAEAQSIVSHVSTFNVKTSYAKTILDKANTSLNRIATISNLASRDFAKDPEKTIVTYSNEISKEIVNLANIMKSWEIVIQDSDNPDAAIQFGKMIENFVNSLALSLKDLGSSVGATNIPQLKTPTSARGNENIKKIQGMLKKIDSSIEQNGILDQRTINLLKNLERQFNTRAKTNKFTNAFVNQSSGYVIDYGNLAEAFKRIEKY